MATSIQDDIINTYQVWEKFSESFGIVFPDSRIDLPDAEKKVACVAALQEILTTWYHYSKHLIPASVFCDTYLDQYKCFDSWLLGQFVQVFLTKHYESQRSQCFEVQAALLRYISSSNPFIFNSLINSYMNFLQFLCDFASQENTADDAIFNWLESSDTIPISLSNVTFRVRNSEISLSANLILSVLSSHTNSICDMCAASLDWMWRCCVKLMGINDIDRACCYRLLSLLVKEDDLPEHEFEFNLPMSELFLHIMNDIGRLCQIGKIREENDMCSMLNVLCEYLRSDTCYDNSYINSVYCLIFQCQLPLNESTENTLLKFYSKLLRLSPDQTDIVNLSAEGNVQPINISLFTIALQNSIERQFEQKSSTSNLEISQSQKLWKCLIEQINKYIHDIERSLETGSIKQTVALFKAVRTITQGAINICHRFNPNFTFFGSEIYSIVGGLMKIMEKFSTKEIYQSLISIVRNILMLPETENDNANGKLQLLAVLTLPLRSFQLTDNLSESLHDRLWDFVDDEVKINCITSLMYIRSLASDYKYLLFNESFAMSGQKVFEYLPVLIYHLTEEELSYFVDYLFHADNEILTKLSPFVEKIICALDGHCVLTKLPEGESIELFCRTCDSKNFSDSIDLPILESRRRIINQFIFSITSASEQAKLDVLRGAIRISNHICESHYQGFLRLLHGCFSSKNANVVEKMVQITPHVLFKNIIDSTDPLDYCGTVLNHDQFASYIKSLQEALVTAVFQCNSTMQYHCIKCIDKIGCIRIEMTLFPCISLLMSPMLLAPSKSCRLARTTVEKIARTHDENEESVYLKYRDDLFPLIKHLICVNFSEYRIKLWELPFDHSIVFSAVTQRHILKYLLPDVVRHSYARKVVEELAEITGVTVSEMLQKSFGCIFVHVMLNESAEMAIDILKLIENETEKKVTDILGNCVSKVLSDLLIHYSDKPDQVKWAILGVRKLLAGDLLQDSSELSQDDDKTIANFVRNRFFGILMNLEAQLRRGSIQKRTRRQIISSLKPIIEMMESEYITKVRFKVLFALRAITCSQKAEYPVQCVQLWGMFIKLIDREVLGPLLSTIFVSLAPLADQQAEPVHNILRYLVVENRVLVQSHLSDLYFVTPDQCDLDTFRVIKNAQPFATMNLEEKLNVLTRFSQNEIVEVKLHALKRLKEELFKHHKEISRLILASDTMNSLIPEIHRVLFEGFRNPDQNVQEAIGTCLGEFGAIDPSYIPNTVIKVDDAKKYTCYPIDGTTFVVETLKVLGRGFQTTEDNSKMDQFALAIQTTLQNYQVRESDQCKYWQQIPEKLREIIQPFFTTNYCLQSELPTDIPYLIYTSEDCKTIQYWARKWSNFLISLLGPDTQERTIFHNIRLVISNDNECMLFFLPYILLKAIFSSPESNVKKIFEEMISIIRDDRRSSPLPDEEHSSTQLVVTEELQTMKNVAEQSMDVICTKTIFHLLDVLNKKCREMRAAARGTSTPQLTKLSNFLAKFSLAQLAEKSFERNEYARSLLYMEEYLSQNERHIDFMDKNLATLAKTYVYLNDVDNVKGLFAQHSRKLRQPQHAIMLHEITDQFQDAAICYQQLLKDSDAERSLFYEIRMIRGYLSMNQPQMALQFAESLSTTFRTKASSDLYDDVKCEALWNLSKYQDLAKVTSTERAQLNDAWGVRIGQAVVHFRNNRPDLLGDELTRIRKTLTKSLHLSSTGYGGYKESYDVVIKLHILNEFEKISEYVFKMLSSSISVEECRTTFESVVKIEFEERLNKLQPVSRVLQPVLNIRQTLFSVARQLTSEKAELQTMFNEEIGKCWLKVIEIANRTRNFQLAYSNILAIDNYKLKGFFIEKAKYYWEKMEPQEALRTLKDGIAHHYSNFEDMIRNKSVANGEDRKICAEAMLLIGTYNDTMVMTDLDTNLEHFLNASKLYPRNEKILVKLAQYYDKISSSVPAAELYRTNCHNYAQMIKYYGYSLIYGCEFIYQSLSRLINIWLDYASKLFEDKRANPAEDRRKAMSEMDKLMDNFITKLPAYYFCTAFSLIISRISHPVAQCFEKLHHIIVKCLKEYPNQMLWQFTSLHSTNSKPTELSQRYQKILNNPQLNQMTPFIYKFQQMFEQFSQLSKASRNLPNGVNGAMSLKTLIRRNNLPLLNSNAQFDNDILIPAQKFLNIILPRSATSETPSSLYNPYPETMVYINRIRDDVHVYASLQKPIRVNMLGTDGNEYVMIFKAYDDMRIDCRCVEFNSVVNMYLKRDVEARDRALCIRTYTVLPLLENTGIIEFLPNLVSMRSVNTQMRKSFGHTSVSVKQYDCALTDSMQKKRETFETLVQLHPPLLHKWFVQEFPNPTSWYTARTSYTRSLAVMSMVGYILGLGDRHNDNILLDSNSGHIIHVDLNVIFNKGETLQFPERVPFRLTHSMIKAMGLLGYEGSFLCTSEIVNRILRERKEQLVSILHMFLYDPPTPANSSKRGENTAKTNIQKVELRLNGCVTVYNKPPSIPLSVEGQTRKLIEEATNKDNLCQMFIGWSAFI